MRTGCSAGRLRVWSRATARSPCSSRTGPFSGSAIETLGRRPVRKLDPPVLAALRVGAYQLAYMGSVPAHAAVNESVELVRAAGLERGVAFTNAVLRRVSEGVEELLAGLGEDAPAAAALKHSYPDWVAEVWWREWGREDALALVGGGDLVAELGDAVVDPGLARAVAAARP